LKLEFSRDLDGRMEHEEEDGNFFETIDGERVRYRVVRRFTVGLPL